MKKDDKDKKKPRVKFGEPNLPFEIVDIDKVDYAGSIPRRIALTDKEICAQLGIKKDLLKFFMKTRTMHPVGKNEAVIFGGLCSEDIAAIAIVSRLIQTHELPANHASELSSQLIHALLESTAPTRVVAILVEANRGDYQIEVRAGRGDLSVPKKFRRYSTIFDGTLLRDQVEAALLDNKLKFPKAKDCVVKG